MENFYQEEEKKFNFETEWLPKDSPEYFEKRFEFLKKCLGESVTEIVKLETLAHTTPATLSKDLIKNMDDAFICMYRPELLHAGNASLNGVFAAHLMRKIKPKRKFYTLN